MANVKGLAASRFISMGENERLRCAMFLPILECEAGGMKVSVIGRLCLVVRDGGGFSF